MEIRELIDLGRWPQAEDAATELLKMAEAAHGTESRAAADAHDLLVAALIANGRALAPKTCEIADRAVELRFELDGADSPAVTESLLTQGKVLKENRQRWPGWSASTGRGCRS